VKLVYYFLAGFYWVKVNSHPENGGYHSRETAMGASLAIPWHVGDTDHARLGSVLEMETVSAGTTDTPSPNLGPRVYDSPNVPGVW
jgi:hypothetical protein